MQNKKLRAYLKTAEEPKDNNEDAYIIEGKTFERDVIIKNDKDIMILFDAPWCGQCKDFYPIYEKVVKN